MVLCDPDLHDLRGQVAAELQPVPGVHPPAGWPAGNCSGGPSARGVLHYSTSLDGPWTGAGPIAYSNSNPGGVPWPPNAGTSNPAPYVFPNGTVLLLGRAGTPPTTAWAAR